MKALDHGHTIFEAEMQLQVPGSPTPRADLSGTIPLEFLSHEDSAMTIKAGTCI